MNLGGYEVVRELGRGGMGVVHEGRASDGRRVALKTLLRPPSREHAERFDREVRLLAALGEADGFVPLLGAGQGPRGPYLVMPFLGGGTLRARLEHAPLPFDQVVALGRTLAEAVGRAHARGIVHRDLKPENVLFTEDGRPLVADLGLAKHFDAQAPGASQSISLTRTGEMRGTAGYAAPEQINDAKSVGPPSDVFALGAMLYEMLTGEAAFRGDSVHETFARVLAAEFEPIRRVRKDVPGWLADVIERALAKEPAKRFADGAALAAALVPPAVEAPPPRRAGVFVGSFVALVVVSAVAAAALRRDGSAPADGVALVASGSPPGSPVAPPRSEPPLPPGASPEHRALVRTRTLALVGVIGRAEGKLEDYVHDLAIVPPGDRALLAVNDGTIALVELASGKVLWAPRAHEGETCSVAVSADGTLGVSSGLDGKVVFWDLAKRERRATVAVQAAGSLALAPDARTLVVAGSDGNVRVLDVARGAELRRVKVHEKAVADVVVAADGRTVFSSSNDGVVARFTIEGNERVALARYGREATQIVLSPDGRTLLAGCWDGRVRLHDARTGELLRTFEGHQAQVRCVAFSLDGLRALSGAADGTVRLWDVAAGREVRTYRGPLSETMGVAFSKGGREAIVAGWDCRLRRIELASGKDLLAPAGAPAGHEGPIAALALLPGGRAVSASRARSGRTWDLATRAVGKDLALAGDCRAMAASPDGERAFFGLTDGKVETWSLATGERAATLDASVLWILGVALSPDGRTLMTGGSDRNLRVWNADTGGEIIALTGHEDEVTAVAFDPDGAMRGYSVGLDRSFRAWTLDGATRQFTLPLRARLFALAVARKRLALVGGEDGSVVGIDRDREQELWRAAAHEGRCTGIAVTPDGKLAATCGWDRTVKLWDGASGKELDRIDLGPALDRANALALAPDGRELIVGTARGVILHYRRRS